MELVLLVLKINKAKVLAIFLILQIMHAYDKKHQKSSSPQKALPLLFSEDVYCSVNIHNFLCMYILLKMPLSSIICFVICFVFFFFFTKHIGNILPLSSNAFLSYPFWELFVFHRTEFCPIVAHFDCVQFFCSYKQSLTEWISLCLNLCTCPWRKYPKIQFWDCQTKGYTYL